jgi:adenylate cyclase
LRNRVARPIPSFYDALSEPVRKHGGFVSEVVGNAMLALWATTGLVATMRAEACRAAPEIMTVVGSAAAYGPYLPTRIGLHCGEVALGNVGAGEHFEYRAVGIHPSPPGSEQLDHGPPLKTQTPAL